MKKHKIKGRNISDARKIKTWGTLGKLNGMYGRTKSKNPNWKGGVSPERQQFYSSEIWKKLAIDVRKRDNYSCVRCGVKKDGNESLHIHHLRSFAIKKYRLQKSNLILLCKKCHNWVHSNKNIKKEFIIE